MSSKPVLSLITISTLLLANLAPAAAETTIEVGSVTIPANGAGTITFQSAFPGTPLVFLTPTTEGTDPATVRLQSVSSTGFQAVVSEPPPEDSGGSMTVPYLALMPGSHHLPDGRQLEAGSVDTRAQVFDERCPQFLIPFRPWETVSFSHTYSQAPALVTQIQSLANEQNDVLTQFSVPFMVVGTRSLTTAGVELILDRVGTASVNQFSSFILNNETIGYLAIEQGTGQIEGADGFPILYSAIAHQNGISSDTMTSPWVNLGQSLGSNPMLFVSLTTRNEDIGGWVRVNHAENVAIVNSGRMGMKVEVDRECDSDQVHAAEDVAMWGFSAGFTAVLVSTTSTTSTSTTSTSTMTMTTSSTSTSTFSTTSSSTTTVSTSSTSSTTSTHTTTTSSTSSTSTSSTSTSTASTTTSSSTSSSTSSTSTSSTSSTASTSTTSSTSSSTTSTSTTMTTTSSSSSSTSTSTTTTSSSTSSSTSSTSSSTTSSTTSSSTTSSTTTTTTSSSSSSSTTSTTTSSSSSTSSFSTTSSTSSSTSSTSTTMTATSTTTLTMTTSSSTSSTSSTSTSTASTSTTSISTTSSSTTNTTSETTTTSTSSTTTSVSTTFSSTTTTSSSSTLSTSTATTSSSTSSSFTSSSSTSSTTSATSTTRTSTTRTSTSITSTTITTTPKAEIGLVAWEIDPNVVSPDHVGGLFDALNKAVDEVKRTTLADLASSGSDVGLEQDQVESGIRVELTETGGLVLDEAPNTSDVPVLLGAVQDARCGNLGPNQCDVQEPDSTTGLRVEQATQTVIGLQRRLQGGGYEFKFEVFTILYTAQEMATMRPIEDPSFLPAVMQALTQRDVTPPRSLAPVQHYAVATTRWAIPEETAAGVVPILQERLLDTSAIAREVDAAVAASNISNTSIIWSRPVTNLCAGRTCGGNGECNEGICRCSESWTGVSCLLPVVEVPIMLSVDRPADENDWQFPLIVTASIVGICCFWIPVIIAVRRGRCKKCRNLGQDEATLQSKQAMDELLEESPVAVEDADVTWV